MKGERAASTNSVSRALIFSHKIQTRRSSIPRQKKGTSLLLCKRWSRPHKAPDFVEQNFSLLPPNAEISCCRDAKTHRSRRARTNTAAPARRTSHRNRGFLRQLPHLMCEAGGVFFLKPCRDVAAAGIKVPPFVALTTGIMRHMCLGTTT